MKKSTDKTSSQRKLVLRREAITVLTVTQLGNVEGAGTRLASCNPSTN